tara:strand:- start:1222 stop:1995 length:774 start_codon:yes stop_codon:yes gene_type:complete
MNKPSITIITINLNNLEGLKRTISSVKNQSFDKIEYIVIDGNSSDGSANYIKYHSNLITKYLIEEDNGVYDAMNKGLRISTGGWVGFLNSGDEYDKDVIKELVEATQTNNFDITFGTVLVKNQQNNTLFYRKPILRNLKHLKSLPAAHMSIFTRRNIIEKFSGFDQDYSISADFDLVSKILRSTSKIYIFKNNVGTFFLGGISSSFLTIIEDFKIHRKNGIPVSLRILILIYKTIIYILNLIVPSKFKYNLKHIFTK